jgi:serine/threonine-protein kinase
MLSIAQGTVIAGRYELTRPLARGAMGAVWVARHLQLNSPVAIKFMGSLFSTSDEARARFEVEAKAAAQIRSVHIVPVLDFGIESDTPYLVMELLEGEDLKARIARGGRLPPGEVVEMVAQVARGLRRAHEAGIVHRDLKPANIFVSQDGDVPLYRVVDFGVAKTDGLSITGPTTQTGQMLGSPLYMSPEQLRTPRAVDARTDLWSLAVIAYRCLTSEMPFPGDDMPAVVIAVAGKPPLPPSRHAPELPRAFDAFFERALAKSPADRFQTATEMAAAFAEAAGFRMGGREAMLSQSGVSLPLITPPSSPSPMPPAAVPGVRLSAPTLRMSSQMLEAPASPFAPRSDPDAPPPSDFVPTLARYQNRAPPVIETAGDELPTVPRYRPQSAAQGPFGVATPPSYPSMPMQQAPAPKAGSPWGMLVGLFTVLAVATAGVVYAVIRLR